MSNNIEIVQLDETLYADSIELSQFAFQFVKTPEEIERIKKQFAEEPADRWGALVDGKLAAQAAVLDLHTYIGGIRFAMGGVAGVATWPEYRRQGLVAKLLVHALENMKRKGQTVSFLHPFAFAFYRKFGWETYTDNKTYTILTEQLPARQPYPGRIVRYTNAAAVEALQFIQPVYESYAARYNGTLARTELWWKERVNRRKPGQTAIYLDVHHKPQGYLRYEVKERQLTVHELICLNEEARIALWTLIAQHDSMIERVTITVPSDDTLPFLLPDPRINQQTVPYFMARIVDAKAFIEQYRFEEAASDDVIPIQITDEHASWNAGNYLLTIGRSGRARLAANETYVFKETHSGITCDIGALTTLLLGYMSATRLKDYGRVIGNESLIKRFQHRIPEQKTFLLDFF